MAGKLPEPVGATRQRLLDRAKGRRSRGAAPAMPGAQDRMIRERVIPALLATLGLGAIAWLAFDIPFVTLIPPLIAVAAAFVLIALWRGRR